MRRTRLFLEMNQSDIDIRIGNEGRMRSRAKRGGAEGEPPRAPGGLLAVWQLRTCDATIRFA
jgi:hypothetical protein